jgi:hypothetical protein
VAAATWARKSTGQLAKSCCVTPGVTTMALLASRTHIGSLRAACVTAGLGACGGATAGKFGGPPGFAAGGATAALAAGLVGVPTPGMKGAWSSGPPKELSAPDSPGLPGAPQPEPPPSSSRLSGGRSGSAERGGAVPVGESNPSRSSPSRLGGQSPRSQPGAKLELSLPRMSACEPGVATGRDSREDSRPAEGRAWSAKKTSGRGTDEAAATWTVAKPAPAAGDPRPAARRFSPKVPGSGEALKARAM